MNHRQIESDLSRKVESYVKNLPDGLRDRVRQSLIITGGSIVSLFLNEKVNDYDIYLSNIEVLYDLMKYYAKELEKSKVYNVQVHGIIDPNDMVGQPIGKEDLPSVLRLRFHIASIGVVRVKSKERYAPVVITDNAISLNNKVQIIVRFFGNPAEIHKNFDFVHVMAYWTYKEGLVVPPKTAEFILSRELKYQGSLYPLASIIRTRKFVSRGWNITAGEYLKMAFQLQEINLKDPAILMDQLMGMDLHYFMALVQRIKTDQENGTIVEINASYIMRLVDEIFSRFPEVPEEESEEEEPWT